MPTNAEVISLQLERVRPKLQELFETSDALFSRIKRASDVIKVSARDLRIPVVLTHGGDYRSFSLDGGDMGRGSGPVATHFVTTYFPTVLAIELTNLQLHATASSEQAVAKAFALATANAIKSMQFYEDVSLHTAGQGVIGTATAQTTGGGFTTYTMDQEFGVQLLRRGMPVHVFSNNLATQRTSSGAVRVVSVNYATNQVTLPTISGAANDDKILFDGVGATPVWKKGLPFFLSTATTGTLLGVDRSTYPEIISNWVSASGALNGLHGMLLLDQIEQRRKELGKNLLAVFHMRQRAAWYAQGIAISEWQRGNNDSPLDIVPKRQAEFSFAGIPAIADPHQSRTRIDVIDLDRWGSAVLKELDWYQVGNQRLFELRGSSGGVASGILMYLEYHADWFTDDPGSQGFIFGLSIPS